MDDVLKGLRVLEVGSSIPVATTGMLLARLGADVIKAEPPEGDWMRRLPPNRGGQSSTSVHLNGGKRATWQSPEMATLARGADVVLADGGSPTARVDLREGAIRLDFSLLGDSGPRRGWRGGSLVASAYGGWMSVCGDPQREPLAVGGFLPEQFAGLCGFTAVLAQLLRGASAGAHIDISVAEVLAANDEYTTLMYGFMGMERQRWFSRHPHFYPMDLFDCQDGKVIVLPVRPAERSALALLIERPDLMDDPLICDDRLRFRQIPAFDALVSPWLQAHGRDAIVERAQQLRLPFAAMQHPLELLDEPQLVARRFWTTIEQSGLGLIQAPSLPWQTNGRPCGPAASAPAEPIPSLGWTEAGMSPAQAQSNTPADRPLEGIKVVDLSYYYAGPSCARILSDLGAEVIKVESGQRIDGSRLLIQPGNRAGDEYWELGGFFQARNAGKLGITLNLAEPRGRELLHDLLRDADVLVEAFTPRVMAGWGMAYESLRARNPRLVMISLTGYGYGGPMSDWAAYGTGMEAAAGISAITGYGPGEERRSGLSTVDFLGGTAGAAAVLAALLQRRSTGKGCHVDLAQRDAAAFLIGDVVLQAQMLGEEVGPTGNERQGFFVRGAFRCAGPDAWVAVEVQTEAELDALRRVTGGGPAQLETWTGGLEKMDAAERLQRAGVPAAPVLSGREVLLDDQFRARGTFQQLRHPRIGRELIPRQFPVEVDGRPCSATAAAPLLGEHNRLILQERLGLTDVEMASLQEGGIIATRPAQLMPEDQREAMEFDAATLEREGVIVLHREYRSELGLGVPEAAPSEAALSADGARQVVPR